MIMAIAMVAMLAFGGTYAYFSAVTGASQTGTVHTALVGIENKSTTATVTTAVEGQHILPTEEFTYEVTVKDMSTRDTFIYVTISLPDGNSSVALAKDAQSKDKIAEGWTLVDGETNVYYKAVTADKTNTEGKEYAFSATFVYNATAESEDGVDATNTMDQDIVISATFTSIQQAGYTAVTGWAQLEA